MKIQTLSIVIPTAKCVNNCKFCVSKMHTNDYVLNKQSFVSQKRAIEKRLKYAILHGVDTIILTGTGEPLQNMRYIEMLSDVLFKLGNPFPRIELQSTSVLLDEEKLTFLKELGVTTISLSVSDIFDNDNNLSIIDTPEKIKFDLENIVKLIEKFDINIRFSLNMTSAAYPDYLIDDTDSSYKYFKLFDNIFNRVKELKSNQVTFRKMYSSGGNTPEDKWVEENLLSDTFFNLLNEYIKKYGRRLYRLPFGGIVYSVNGVSTVVDDDCMNEEFTDETLKYLILRENMKLFSHWDDEGSLIF